MVRTKKGRSGEKQGVEQAKKPEEEKVEVAKVENKETTKKETGKKKTEKKKTGKKDGEKEKVEKVDIEMEQEDGEDNEEGGEKTLLPSHNLHLARKQNAVKCRVDLYRIPPMYINFEPTDTHFYVDTLKFSKKYVLKVPYPEGVTVDPEQANAKFDSGVLTCDIPITNDPNKPADLDEVVKYREEVKALLKARQPVPDSLMKLAKWAKPRRALVKFPQPGKHVFPVNDKGEKLPEPPKEEEKKEEAKGKGHVQGKGKKEKELVVKVGEKHNPKSNKEVRKERKRKDGELLDEEGQYVPKSKRQKAEPSVSKKKKFVDDANVALKLADQVNDLQDKETQEKQDKEYAKLSVLTRKRLERNERKRVQKETKQQHSKEIEETLFDKEKPEKKKSETKVSFA